MLQQNSLSIYQGQQIRLRKAVSERVYQLTNNPGARPALFRSIYADLNERYKVASYKFIKQQDFQSALRFIAGWGR